MSIAFTKLILAQMINFLEKGDIEGDWRETFDILMKGQVKDLKIGSAGTAKKTILKSVTNNFPLELAYPKVEPGYPFPQTSENSEISSVSKRNFSRGFNGDGRFFESNSEVFTLINPR